MNSIFVSTSFPEVITPWQDIQQVLFQLYCCVNDKTIFMSCMGYHLLDLDFNLLAKP